MASFYDCEQAESWRKMIFERQSVLYWYENGYLDHDQKQKIITVVKFWKTVIQSIFEWYFCKWCMNHGKSLSTLYCASEGVCFRTKVTVK